MRVSRRLKVRRHRLGTECSAGSKLDHGDAKRPWVKCSSILPGLRAHTRSGSEPGLPPLEFIDLLGLSIMAVR